jgi:hypothetical protein
MPKEKAIPQPLVITSLRQKVTLTLQRQKLTTLQRQAYNPGAYDPPTPEGYYDWVRKERIVKLTGGDLIFR